MKCPKCGYHSFEYLDNCKKCSHDLREHKAKYNLRGLNMPVIAAVAEEPVIAAVAEEPVIAAVAEEPVIAAVAEEPVIAAAAEESATVDAEKIATVDSADDESIDFGFDFLEEDDEQVGKHQERITLGSEDQDINLDQAFDFDNEAASGETSAEKKDKSEKGPEFAF